MPAPVIAGIVASVVVGGVFWVLSQDEVIDWSNENLGMRFSGTTVDCMVAIEAALIPWVQSVLTETFAAGGAIIGTAANQLDFSVDPLVATPRVCHSGVAWCMHTIEGSIADDWETHTIGPDPEVKWTGVSDDEIHRETEGSVWTGPRWYVRSPQELNRGESFTFGNQVFLPWYRHGGTGEDFTRVQPWREEDALFYMRNWVNP